MAQLEKMNINVDVTSERLREELHRMLKAQVRDLRLIFLLISLSLVLQLARLLLP